MKVMLISPPVKEFTRKYGSFGYLIEPDFIPIGIAALGAWLEERGVSVFLLDASYMDGGEIRECVRRYAPDVAGISALTLNRYYALKLAGLIKDARPGVKIVMGNAHSTIMWKQILLNYPAVDYVVRGEGELPFFELVKLLENGGGPGDAAGIKGVTCIKDGLPAGSEDLNFIENIDSLPLPLYSAFDLSAYPSGRIFSEIYGKKVKKAGAASIVSSRGCPYSCYFCASRVLWRGSWRGQGGARVVKEMLHLRERYNIGFFNFRDENFTVSKKRVLDICAELKRSGLDAAWKATARLDNIDEEMLCAMSGAGCVNLAIGIESGSEKVLKLINKEISKDRIESVFALVKKCGIRPDAFFILGNTGETRETLRETEELIYKIRPYNTHMCYALPLPGTALYETVGKKGGISDASLLEEAPPRFHTGETSFIVLDEFRERFAGAGAVVRGVWDSKMADSAWGDRPALICTAPGAFAEKVISYLGGGSGKKSPCLVARKGRAAGIGAGTAGLPVIEFDDKIDDKNIPRLSERLGAYAPSSAAVLMNNPQGYGYSPVFRLLKKASVKNITVIDNNYGVFAYPSARYYSHIIKNRLKRACEQGLRRRMNGLVMTAWLSLIAAIPALKRLLKGSGNA